VLKEEENQAVLLCFAQKVLVKLVTIYRSSSHMSSNSCWASVTSLGIDEIAPPRSFARCSARCSAPGSINQDFRNAQQWQMKWPRSKKSCKDPFKYSRIIISPYLCKDSATFSYIAIQVLYRHILVIEWLPLSSTHPENRICTKKKQRPHFNQSYTKIMRLIVKYQDHQIQKKVIWYWNTKNDMPS